MNRLSILCAGLLAQAAPLVGTVRSNNKYVLSAPTGPGLSDYGITVGLAARSRRSNRGSSRT